MNMLLLKGLDLLSQLPLEEVITIMDNISNSATNDNQATPTANNTTK